MTTEPATILLDTSAIVAILTHESTAADLARKLLAAELRYTPVPCVAEATLVLFTKLGRDPWPTLLEFLREFDIELVPFAAHHLAWFSHGYQHYGKGRHKASLNMGDCFTYAIAKSSGFSVLFTGTDFLHTDLTFA
ncbi:MAG: type II toxin-antitoxin system VapC family toxin [Bryobacteraceae bacterium]